ncbi:ImmA/IrrE family metallo-endopeptidase [bacterium]|nr:ImmA/IrrE family metallo-endopeptidase [bacterium]
MYKVIKTEKDYESAMREIDKLMFLDPDKDTEKGDRLELLAFLISAYEEEHFPIGLPNPIEALRFRMEQQGLTQRDLMPYIGSRSKVSEVLSGKRRLTLKMIRALHKGLHIPADVLLQEHSDLIQGMESEIAWDKFPVREMAQRSWFSEFRGKSRDAVEQAEELMTGLFRRAGISSLEPAFLRRHVRSGSQMDSYALVAWWARVVELAQNQPLPKTYAKGSIDKEFMANLVSLSYFKDGPQLAKEYLNKSGIHFVLLRHLTRTHLDGAAMLLPDGTPVVALTLRYDRLDNFWFCLCHELAHVALHLEKTKEDRYFDDLDVSGDASENEADRFAENSLLPKKRWASASVRSHYNSVAVKQCADRLKIHPAIVAGRIRKEQNNYRILWQLVGKGEVRGHFAGFETGIG